MTREWICAGRNPPMMASLRHSLKFRGMIRPSALCHWHRPVFTTTAKTSENSPAVLLLCLADDEDQGTKAEPCREGKLPDPGVTAQLRTTARKKKKKKARRARSACGCLAHGRREPSADLSAAAMPRWACVKSKQRRQARSAW